MKKAHTKFKGLILIKGKTHYDRRGFFRELIHQNLIPIVGLLYMVVMITFH